MVKTRSWKLIKLYGCIGVLVFYLFNSSVSFLYFIHLSIEKAIINSNKTNHITGLLKLKRHNTLECVLGSGLRNPIPADTNLAYFSYK